MTTRSDEADRLWAALGDPMRIRLLDLLLEQGEATASTLSAALPITRQGVSKHLAVLERDGLINLGASSGPKPGVISLTPKGRETLRRAQPRWREAHDAVEKVITGGNFAAVLQTLKQLRRQARAFAEDEEA